MCGIVAVLRRPARRPPPAAEELLTGLDAAVATAATVDPGPLHEAARQVGDVDQALRGVPGVRALLSEAQLASALEIRLDAIEADVRRIEARLDAGEQDLTTAELEAVNAALVGLKDGCWAIRNDRLRTAQAVAELAGSDAPATAVEGYTSVQLALSAIDRLEVRGRDSAGLHVLVQGHDLDLSDPAVQRLLGDRIDDRLFTGMSVRTPDGHLAFVYKAAAEIGELGDNTRRLREAIRADDLLRRALSGRQAQASVLGHTRWASVGLITEANAHPLNQEEEGRPSGPYVVAALNGDVDNHPALKLRESMSVPAEVTTDAKIIPVLLSRRLDEGLTLEEAFRTTAHVLDGSVAVAAACGSRPGRLLLALRGSGQALYIGMAEDAYVVASEPYGLVEETSRYLRMDGESGEVAGQVVVLERDAAGTVEGIDRIGYDGTILPVDRGEIRTAEITTRDVERQGFPHYLLKEISQAPLSVQKTLRGRLVLREGRPLVVLGDEVLPPVIRQRLADKSIRRIVAIGQGTAAVAAQSLTAVLSPLLSGSGVSTETTPATELSGFGLADDMADTLVVAVSQSGTTTDTNRTVDLVRARGAAVIGIVNRRNSDLVEKVDGVLYTSDGRDVEMAVPSTKAFYAQVAAGVLLAVALAEALGCKGRSTAALLLGLRRLPEAMQDVLARRPAIAAAAQRHAPPRRYWAVVGNGGNRIAAQELRIKLSELCYKSIAFDLTEDKKHIDLSSEPLILVCAAGLSGTNADDVAKEVAIYRAHKAAPIVIADDGITRFDAALEVLPVPPVEPALGFVLSAMVGHLFGYEAALAIDAQARPLREIRAAVETVFSGDGVVPTHVALEAAAATTGRPQRDGFPRPEPLGPGSPHAGPLGPGFPHAGPMGPGFPHAGPIGPFERLRPIIEAPVAQFMGGLHAGRYDGHLEASTALRVATLLRHATSPHGLEAYELETGRVATPTAVVTDLADALTRAIGELTRPVDAIKHQAKTVTVGISRSEEALYSGRLVEAVLAAGTPRDRLGYRALRSLVGLEPAVAEVTGYTRYVVEGRVGEDATLRVLDRGGVARQIPSRTERDPRLLGTKHRAATLREVLVARGGADQRTVVIVPEVKDGDITGLTLLHAAFNEQLPAEVAQAVLAGYLDRYDALVDAVTEREPGFDESVLGKIPIVDLLTQPVHLLAEHWRSNGSGSGGS